MGSAAPCAGCHPGPYRDFATSQHAAACRAFDAGRDPGVPGAPSAPVGVIGVRPIWQALLSTASGRIQVFDPAFDVDKREWYSIFGANPPRPEEWGHWTQRGMTWNAQCAYCHMTGLRKGYDPTGDTYRTTWTATGIGCAQCHGDLDGHDTRPDVARQATVALRQRATDACGSCHSRREELTEGYRPGEAYDDHYRLLLADTPELHHPDGQASDEVFELGSLSLSRMGHAGVGCLDCHEPHGGRLRASIDDDSLCLGCHAAPGRRGAVVVDAATHRHHRADGPGGRCVSCHMPEKTYMGRDRRRDHGFTSPDPRLAAELGLPDACTGCHAAKDARWAIEKAEGWYGAAKLDNRARRRARAVHAARRGDRSAVPELLAVLANEPNAAWRSSLAGLMAPFVDAPAVRTALVALLDDEHPLVKVAAIRSLARIAFQPPGANGGAGGGQEIRDRIVALRKHPVRVVRLTASWATRSVPFVTGDETSLREMREWLVLSADQPAGALRQCELAIVEKRSEDAVAWATKAVAWDPSGPSFHTLARALAAAGRPDEARAAMQRAQSLLHGSRP